MRPLTEIGADGVVRYAGWQNHVDGADAVFVSTPAFAEKYYAMLNDTNRLFSAMPFRPLSRIERAKDRVRRLFDAATDAGVAIDLEMRQ